MQIKKITLLVDLTGVSQLALEHTAIIARQSICQVTLLHIAASGKEHLEKEIKTEIREFASLLEKEGVSFAIKVNYGNFFEVIAASIEAIPCDLLIIGTHGIKGFKQNFMSSNIIRLMSLISVPAFIIQGHSPMPQEGYLNILVPILDVQDSSFMEKPLIQFASLFHSKLHFLAYYNKENQREVTAHTNALAAKFKEAGLQTAVELEETSVYTSSYSKSIIQYADIEDVEVILLVIHEHGGMTYFDAADKENILLNRFGKPTLCL